MKIKMQKIRDNRKCQLCKIKNKTVIHVGSAPTDYKEHGCSNIAMESLQDLGKDTKY